MNKKKRKNWEECENGNEYPFKELIVEKALMAKFQQNNNMKFKLLSTRNRNLVEHTKNDCYWGDGGNGSGRNRLGFWLQKVRTALKEN